MNRSINIKLIIEFTFFILICFNTSCKKEPERENTLCPESINNVDYTNYPMDTYSIDSAYYQDEKIHIQVTYGGGCEEHYFNLIQEPIFCGTPPVNLMFYLAHDSNQDGCYALITQELCFDISKSIADFPTSETYISLYIPDNNTFDILN